MIRHLEAAREFVHNLDHGLQILVDILHVLFEVNAANILHVGSFTQHFLHLLLFVKSSDMNLLFVGIVLHGHHVLVGAGTLVIAHIGK